MADSQKYTSPVPTDYQEVEYIQSSGNGEYIDIDYTPTINTKFELDFAFVSSTYSQSDSIPVMGERSGTTASDTNKFALWVHKGNGRETLNFGSYDSGFQTATNASLRNVTSNDKAKLYYNGTFVSGDDSATFTSGNLSIYLFALNNNGALLSRNNVMKVYNMKLYESGTLVRDLIPCYRKTDNVAGLYDTINDVFYTNHGSGSISVGTDVNAWQHSLRKLTTATEAVENPLYSDGTAITAYTIKGNTIQNGTPTPSNPVEVNGVGELDGGQYKIPISSGGVTTNIYLGSTQTVRAIKKYTFTGEETIFSCIATTDGQNYCVAYRFMDFGMTDIKDFDKIMQDIDYPIFISTHFKEKTNTNSEFNNIQPNQVGANTVSAAGNRYIIFCVSGLTTAADYSAWFAQQYTNGTPVEVYYILETETTAAVNEPLMKIGTYADTLSNATAIPTTEGANSITVDTTVQPSEFTATWTGWHDSSVKEWDGSDWN